MKIAFPCAVLAAAATLAAVPAHAGLIFSQSPPNLNAIDITYGRAADAFRFSGEAFVTGVNFWYQTDTSGFPTDLSTVTWAMYANAGGSLGTELYSGTATPTTSFDGVNDADFATFTVPGLVLNAGTYWLELHAGSSFTDNNNFLSIWWSNTDLVPTLSALTDSGTGLPGTASTTTGFQSLAFQFTGAGGSVDNAVPEPASYLLVGAGLVMLIARSRNTRRKPL